MDEVFAEAIARLERRYGPDWKSLDGKHRAEAIYEEMRRIDAERFPNPPPVPPRPPRKSRKR